MQLDEYYMARALRLAELGRYSCQPNPRVGCLIVRDGRIVGEGYHQQAGQGHAEVNALAQAGEQARGADVYVTLEPCSHHGKTPPCADALVKAQPARVVIAMTDPNPRVAGSGIECLKARGIEVRSGVCEDEARQLNRGFIRRMMSGRPFVSLKLATSLDGRIAMRSGQSAWITSDAARRDVHRLRLESCAVLTGIGTVLADNPRMTSRLEERDLPSNYFRNRRQPVRVVLDSQGKLPVDAALLGQPGETWQFLSDAGVQNGSAQRTVSLPGPDGGIDLSSALAYLGENGINNLLVEAGGNIAASFIKSGLLDELIVYQSPDIMGASAQAMVNLPDILKMSEKIKFEYQDLRKIGRDLKLSLIPTATH